MEIYCFSILVYKQLILRSTLIILLISLIASKAYSQTDTSESITFMLADELPRIEGCVQEEKNNYVGSCTMKKVFEFLHKEIVQIDLPKNIEQGITGKIFAQFVISEHGEIENVVILNGDNESFDENIKEVILGLNKFTWIPASTRGKNVPFKMILPIQIHFK